MFNIQVDIAGQTKRLASRLDGLASCRMLRFMVFIRLIMIILVKPLTTIQGVMNTDGSLSIYNVESSCLEQKGYIIA